MRTNRIKTKIIIGLSFVVVSSMIVTCGVWAKGILSEDDEAYFSQNNVLFYEPCSTSNSGKQLGGEISIAGATAEEKVWSGLASFLSDEQAAGIMGNIAQEDGNYNPLRREVGQSGKLYNRSTQMGLGLVQWSFGRRVNLLNYVKDRDSSLIQYFEDNSLAQMTGDDLIKKLGDDTANKIYQVEIEFLKQEIDSGYKEYYNQTVPEDAAVWFEVHFERAGVANNEYRKKKAKEAYDKYAGKTISGASAGSSTGSAPSCNSCEPGSKNINGTGACLAWPLGTDESKYTLASGKVLEPALNSPGQSADFPGTGSGTPEFQKAWVASGLGWPEDTLDGTGVYSWRYGAYCSGFTATVVRYSGYDENFTDAASVGGYEQVSHARKHPDLWDVAVWDENKESLKGGDILVSADHSWMVVEDEAGELYTVEASLHSYTFGHISKYNKNTTTRTYRLRATKANNSTAGVSVTNGVQTSSTTGTIAKDGKGNGDIGASAIELAWPKGTDASVYRKSPTDKFKNYFSSLEQSKLDNGKCYGGGKSCDRFVATSIRYSGVDKNFHFGPVDSGTLPYLEATEAWEEIKMKNYHSLAEYESGDVLIFYKKGASSPSHTAIYAKDSSGEGHVVQASYCEKYGVVEDTSSITNPDRWGSIRVFRNRNNGSGNNTECNLCSSSSDDAADGTIVEGGFKTTKDAQRVVDAYLRANLNKVPHLGYACQGDLHRNCVNFSKWFIDTYLDGMTTNFLGNGGDIADNFYNKNKGSFPKLKESSVPVAYSIFSVRRGPLTSSSAGHTGVILGINGDQVIYGEAGWCGSSGRIGTMSIKEFTSHQYQKYIDVNAYIKGGL